MRRAACCLTLALLSSPAMGQTPPSPSSTIKAVATTRATYPSGSVVFVDARASTSAWPLQYGVVGRPDEPRFVLDGGKGAIFPALPDGTWYVAVTAAGPKDNAPPTIDTTVVQVTVGSVGTDPSPIPTPTPAPKPAADPLGFTALTRTTLASLPWKSEDVKPGATVLYGVYAAAVANAAKYPTAQAMTDATAVAAKQALGTAAFASWKPFIAPINARVASLSAQGKLSSVAELAEAYFEIALALKEVL